MSDAPQLPIESPIPISLKPILSTQGGPFKYGSHPPNHYCTGEHLKSGGRQRLARLEFFLL